MAHLESGGAHPAGISHYRGGADMIRKYALIGGAILVALALAWTVYHLRAGAEAEARAAALKSQLELHEAAAEDRARVNEAEAARLSAEEETRQTYGRLLDEAASDPGAANPALGLRSVQRLNAIR